MKTPPRLMIYVVAVSFVAGGLWAASQWWEKGLAIKLRAPTVSPNGCYRVKAFKPFWVLPNIFHPRVHPDEPDKPQWFPWWGYPGFYRFFDNRSGELIGESEIYDLESASGRIYWGDGTGEVSTGLITIGPNLTDCMGDNP